MHTQKVAWNLWGFRNRGIGVLWALLLMALGFAAHAQDVAIGARWAAATPKIDGLMGRNEWKAGRITPLAHGKLVTMNDGQYLYALLDFVDDTGNDAVPKDYYVLAVDADLNHAVTPNVDFNYDVCNDGQPFIKSYYLSASSFTSCRPVNANSLHGRGFGATFNSSTPHRFYEFRLSLAELGVDVSEWTTSSGNIPRVRFNVAGYSATPPIGFSQPDANPFPDMTGSLYVINLAALPSYPVGGSGPIFAGVGLVPANYIDNLGYANLNVAGYPYSAFQAPFGGNLNVFGNWATLKDSFGAKSYRINYSKDGGPLTPLIQTWTNFKYNLVTGNWDPVAFAPDATGKYTIPNNAALAPYYLPNLLTSWQTGQFADGAYRLSLELFDAGGNPIAIPSGNSLTLYMVNTPPTVKINKVLYNGSQVAACAIVTQGGLATDGFNYDITVSDARGALNAYSLIGIYGNNQSSFVYSDAYNPGHLNQDGQEKWNGGSSVVPASRWKAPAQCAYSFILAASSRSQNGYGAIFPNVEYHISLTVLTGAAVSSVTTSGAPCCGADSVISDALGGGKPMGLPE